jgi:hypothetical protein
MELNGRDDPAQSNEHGRKSSEVKHTRLSRNNSSSNHGSSSSSSSNSSNSSGNTKFNNSTRVMVDVLIPAHQKVCEKGNVKWA